MNLTPVRADLSGGYACAGKKEGSEGDREIADGVPLKLVLKFTSVVQGGPEIAGAGEEGSLPQPPTRETKTERKEKRERTATCEGEVLQQTTLQGGAPAMEDSLAREGSCRWRRSTVRETHSECKLSCKTGRTTCIWSYGGGGGDKAEKLRTADGVGRRWNGRSGNLDDSSEEAVTGRMRAIELWEGAAALTEAK